MLFLPPLAATKIAGCVMLALVPAGLAVMLHGMRKQPQLALASLPLVWCSLANWGFLNFVGALGLFAMTIGWTLLVLRRPTRGRRIALGLTLVALYFTHIFRFPFALAAVVGTTIVVVPRWRRAHALLLPVAPAALLFV